MDSLAHLPGYSDILGEFRVVLGLSVALDYFTSILGSSNDLNFPSTWDFSVVLELSSMYMKLGTWMLEEYYSENTYVLMTASVP